MAEAPDNLVPRGRSRWPLAVFALLVCVVVVTGGAIWGLWLRDAGGPARHVILISMDTTRADYFGCYGNNWVRTPRIDQIAGESILFSDYMTVVSTTLASHTSLFTGKYPHTHGVPRNGFVAHDNNLMLAEVLKEAGFRTAGFLGSFALDKRFNVAQGFDYYDQGFDILAGARGVDQNQRRADAVTDAVIDYLDREGVPLHLFLFVHYFDPHTPYDPPPPYDQMYASADAPPGIAEGPTTDDDTGPQRQQRRNSLYAGEISYLDHHIGRLLDALRTRGILDEALLIVTSDHGENLGEMAPWPGHGWSTYQVEMRAVCMYRLPGARHGGTRVEAPVTSVDILPTVANFLGLPAPAEVEGEVIDLETPREAASWRTRFGEATKPWEDVERDPRWHNNPKPCCVREGPLKYIRTLYQSKEELYDVAADPYEHVNLLLSPTPEITARAAELRQKLHAWTAAAKPLPTHFDSSQQEETIRRLRALGYLGGEDGEEDEGEGTDPNDEPSP